MTDNYYIQKVIEGDKESFRYLVNSHKDKAFSVAFSVLRNATLAEDVVQEAFINAFRKLSTFRGDALFATWLMRIVVNESIKVIRKNKTEIEGAKDLADISEVDVNVSLKSINDSEQKLYIDKALKQMPQRDALVLQLFYLEELSLKEMEEILNIKYDHIKVLLHRARKQFYTILEEELKHELTTLI